MRFLRDIRPGERRETLAAFFVLFGLMAAHAMLETARDALFLASIPPERLPWVYLLIAVVSVGLFALQQRALHRAGDRFGFTVWLIAAAVVNLGLWFLLRTRSTVELYVLYVWTGVFATLFVVRFWTVTADGFSVTQAKRLYAFIGSGAAAGAIAGSALATGVTGVFGASALLPLSAAILVITGLVPVRFLTPSKPSATQSAGVRREGVLRSLQILRRQPYLRRVGAIVLLSAVVLTTIDFLFKRAVALNVPPGSMGTFFAATYLVLNVLSLGVQVFFVSRLLRRVRVSRVLNFMPLLLLGAGVAVLAGGGFLATLLLRGFDGTFRHSLHRTALEVLYVPLTGDIRNKVKGVIDVIGQRGGQAVASLAILGVAATSYAEPILAGIVVVLLVVWIVVARSIQGHYLDLFRETLSDASIETRFEYPELDLASLETLMAGLNSLEDREVLASLDILAEQDRVRLIPALILYHPSHRVVVRALELFSHAGRDDFLPMTTRLLDPDRGDPEVRAATLRALSWVAPDADLFSRYMEDDSPIVKATALVGAVSYGGITRAEADETMLTMAGWGSVEQRVALARAVQYSPGQAYEGLLIILAQAPDQPVLLAVVRAMREIRSPLFIPPLVAMLPDRALRASVRETLFAIGNEALIHLQEALANPHCNPKIRMHLPRAIAQFEAQAAADILLPRLEEELDGPVRYRVLRALLLLRERNTSLRLNAKVIDRRIDFNVRMYFRSVAWMVALERGNRERPRRKTAVQGLVFEILGQKAEQTVERLFHLLRLRHDHEDARFLYRGLRSQNREVRSSSFELLENLLESPVREAVLAMVDDVPNQERLGRAGSSYTYSVPGYEELLLQLLERPGVGIRSLVVFHIGELGLRRFRNTLETLPSDLEGLVTSEVNRTLEKLAEAGTDG